MNSWIIYSYLHTHRCCRRVGTSTATRWELISALANRNCKLCLKPIRLTDPLRKNVNSDHSQADRQAAYWPCRVDQRPGLAWRGGGGSGGGGEKNLFSETKTNTPAPGGRTLTSSLVKFFSGLSRYGVMKGSQGFMDDMKP